ncbi:hypothetical protein [Acinetobacter johnsonii]|uniref:hypothetical protein n=1 Tax=Acinetobacter johnsonii TaxID=40214 RepID=UPI0032B372FA
MSDDLDKYIEMRQELEVMTHAELVEEVINRMKFQQQIVIDNWNENKELRKEVQDSRRFLESTYENLKKWNEDLDEIVAKGLYWKRSFYVLLMLMIIVLIYSFTQTLNPAKCGVNYFQTNATERWFFYA